MRAFLVVHSAWVRRNDEFAKVINLVPEPAHEEDAHTTPPGEGSVYLLKSGDYFKIGRSDEIVRRVKQIGISMPEE